LQLSGGEAVPRERFVPKSPAQPEATPFDSADAAWFWTVQARLAQLDGARVSAGRGLVARPCEPIDVLTAVDRLYRRRRLLPEHLRVLADYGRQHCRPDPDSRRQRRAAHLWQEAMAELTPVLAAKGIVVAASACVSEPAGASEPARAAAPGRPDPVA
jgi:hypothetical protein